MRNSFRLEGTSGGLYFILPVTAALVLRQTRFSQTRMLRSMSSCVLKTSKDRDCSTFLCNLFQYFCNY